MHEYQLIKNCPATPKIANMGSPTGFAIGQNRSMFVFHRAGRHWLLNDITDHNPISGKTILVLDIENGLVLKSWGDHLFMMPHGLKIDDHQNVWLTDVQLHQVFKFDKTGTLLMTLGTARIPGDGPTHFNGPTDVAIGKDGSLYVSDGYFNNRIIKFDPTGKYLFEWGETGTRPGQFNLPHAVELHEDGNVYVADRENNRIQIFTPDGRFKEQWTHEKLGKISSIAFDKNTDRLFAVDYTVSPKDEVTGSSVIEFDRSGEMVGRSASQHGLNCWFHNVLVDAFGKIFVTDIMNDRVLKFERV